MSKKFEIINDLVEQIRRVTQVPEVNVLKEPSGEGCQVIPDTWVQDGPSRQGFSLRVLCQFQHSKDEWQKVLIAADDFIKWVESDCNWTDNDKTIQLKAEFDSAQRLEDDSNLIIEVAINIYDVM